MSQAINSHVLTDMYKHGNSVLRFCIRLFRDIIVTLKFALEAAFANHHTNDLTFFYDTVTSS